MDPTLKDFLKDAANVLLGCLLALGSAAFADWWKNRRKVSSIKKSIRIELKEIAHRLLGVVYAFEQHVGYFDREFVKWLHEQEQRYSPTDDELRGVVSKLASFSEEELTKYAAKAKAESGPRFTPLQEASYTKSVIALLHDLDETFSARVLDILSHLEMFNENRKNWDHWFKLTFSGLRTENYMLAVDNVKKAEAQMLNRSRIVVDKITKLEE